MSQSELLARIKSMDSQKDAAYITNIVFLLNDLGKKLPQMIFGMDALLGILRKIRPCAIDVVVYNISLYVNRNLLDNATAVSRLVASRLPEEYKEIIVGPICEHIFSANSRKIYKEMLTTKQEFEGPTLFDKRRKEVEKEPVAGEPVAKKSRRSSL